MPFAVALLACLVAVSSGCAGSKSPGGAGLDAPPMTLSDFYGFCSSLPTPTSCYSDPLCNRFRRELAVAPRELDACLKLCRSTENALYVDNLVNGCEGILDRAETLCEQFCRRHDAATP